MRLQSLHLRRPFQRAMPFQILGDATLFCKPAHQRTDLIVRLAVDAGKVLCAAAIDLLEQPALLEAAKAEFRQRTAGGYTCPIPADAVPAPLEL